MTPYTKPDQESPVLFKKGILAVIAGIVILLVAILVAGMMQAGQGTVVPPATGSGVQKTPQATPAPVTSARPVVDLYVMSFCPFGTQAETVMSPVVGLLGSKADIRVRYITTITGSTVDSVDSLHGMSEAAEDLQQICLNKYYPDKYWAYLNTFNAQCYPSWQDAAVLDSCRKNTTAALSMDSARIDTCARGSEGLALLMADETASAKDSATASPTLFINGVRYPGSRTPEAYKQAICNSFETVPAECSTVLSSATASGMTGGCG
jgi:glutaredoxin